MFSNLLFKVIYKEFFGDHHLLDDKNIKENATDFLNLSNKLIKVLNIIQNPKADQREINKCLEDDDLKWINKYTTKQNQLILINNRISQDYDYFVKSDLIINALCSLSQRKPTKCSNFMKEIDDRILMLKENFELIIETSKESIDAGINLKIQLLFETAFDHFKQICDQSDESFHRQLSHHQICRNCFLRPSAKIAYPCNHPSLCERCLRIIYKEKHRYENCMHCHERVTEHPTLLFWNPNSFVLF